MAVDLNSYVLMAMPIIKSIVWLVVGLGLTVGLGYYLFVIRRRKTWFANIWEQKADGKIHLVGKDILLEKRINKGKQVIYKLRRRNVIVIPPPYETVNRLRSKEYVDYLEISEDYIPIKKDFQMTAEERKGIIAKINGALADMKNRTTSEIEREYVYVPVSQSLNAKFNYEPMDYDVNMMRIQAIDIRDKIYQDQQGFWDKYGTLISIGAIVVLIIVVLYMSYDYSSNVISMAFGESQKTTTMIQGVADKMVGTPPPS